LTWNYRILKRDSDYNGQTFSTWAMHEVYYNKDGKPEGYTEDPITFIVDDLSMGKDFDGEEELVKSLQMAYEDAINKPVLIVKDIWPEEND